MKIQHLMALVVLSLATVPGARAAVRAGPITNAANGHLYYLLSPNNWTSAEAEARGLGGHLVTINDAAENQWVVNTFFPLIVNSGPDALLWLGLNDAATEGQFVCASGEPVTFTNWYPGEPNNLGGEDYAAIRNPFHAPPTGSWNDTDGFNRALAQTFGVVEVPPPSPPWPVAVTQPADQFTPVSARLNGLANPSGTPALAWFEWGTSFAYGNVTPPQAVGFGTSAVGFSNVLVGLVIGTEYHFRAHASNAVGVAAGVDQTFNLNNQRPAVTTLAADQLTTNSALLSGQVNPRGWPTAAWFEWGTNTTYGNVIGMQDVGQGSSMSNLNVVLDGLTSGPIYHYRLVATNTFGFATGADQTFNLNGPPPVVTTLAADQLTANSARLRGQVNPRGSPTAAWFEWGTNTTYGNVIGMQEVGQGSSVSNLNVVLDGLTSGPIYHYRLVATNVFGAVSGADQTINLAQVNYVVVSGIGAAVTRSPNASGDIVIASTYSGSPVTWIVSCAFCSCTNLTSVTIPYGVTRLGSPSPVFSGCTSLMNISVDPANTTFSSLDGVVFNKAQTTLITFPPGRGSYVIPNSVTSIGSSAFVNCTALTSVTIPNSVIGIGDGAFSGCTSLTNVTIPNGVTGIGQQAFSGCTNLTSVTIGSSVTSMGTTLYSSPFDGCTSLTNFSVDAANLAFSSLNGVVFDKAQTTLILFPPGRGGSYVIPASVTNIGVRAFAGCKSLTNVTIGNGVTNIGPGAFSGCTSLASVTIPNSVTIIPDRAFENCTSLTSVTIPNGVITIGSDAFNGCTSLTSVTIPDSVTQIGTSLYAGGGNAFANCTSLTNVIIGNSVTNIGTRAFSACSNLTRLTIPASVINLGYAAFLGSLRLTKFTFLGNPPRLIFDMDGGYAQFQNVGAGAKVYYYSGTTGWGASYGVPSLPTVMLCPPQMAPGSAGMKPGGFGFTVTRLTNQTIVVEASADLLNWQPIWTNTPPGTSTNFVDPEWLNHSNRFYRARSD